MAYIDIKNHFSKKYSSRIIKFAKNIFSNYIFVESPKASNENKRIGYCTYCCKKFYTDKLAHNSITKCPKCKKEAQVKLAGLGRGQMIDEAYFVCYEKSVVNPSIIVARGIYAVKDYRGDYKNVKTQMKDRCLYVFEIGKPVMYRRYSWYTSYRGDGCYGDLHIQTGTYEKCSKIYSDFSHFWNKAKTLVGYDRGSISAAVKKTPFQYSTWESYDDLDMTKFFNLYSKYPCIEYLTKGGFQECVKDKLYERLTYGAINWNGKNFLKVLRLSKNDIKAIKSSGYKIDSFFLRIYQMSKKDGSNLSCDEINEINTRLGTCNYKDIQNALKYSSLRKVFNYIQKQYDISQNSKNRYYSMNNALTDYKDYLNDCVSLEMNMASERVLFPKSLYKAHQNTIKQIKLKGDEILDSKIAKRLKDLSNKYSFEFNGIFIRPAASTDELINEGKKLNHCVGTYAQRYAEGSTNILFIRRVNDPDTSYYTMEISNSGTIVQTRGKGNCAVIGESAAFMEVFREKLSGNKKEQRIRITVPA